MNLKFNKSDYILLVIFYSASAIIQTYSYYEENNVLLEYLIDIPTTIIFSLILIYIFIFLLIPKYFVKNKEYLLFAIYGLVSLAVFGIIDYTIGFWTGGNDWSKFPNGIKLIIYGIDTGSETIAFPLGILLTKKFYEGHVVLAKTKQQQKESELKLLRSQIDPHFLFNNLNTLDSLIDSNPEKAKEYINRLSLIYRYLIQTKDAEVMELTEEINLAKNYLFLIKTRFEKDYTFEIKAPISFANKFIPTGAIQALLENVVKHNKSENNKPIKTTIVINDDRVIVTNTKSKTTSAVVSFGTGLENLKARYKLLSNQEIKVNNTVNTFEISIPIIGLSDED